MFLSEPPSTQGDLHFKALGFPVRVSPWFWLFSAVLGWQEANGSATNILIWIVAMFVSILIHELGHALALRYYGFGSRIVLYALGGLAIPEAAGYRDSYGDASPSVQRPNDGWQQIVISLAGPIAGFLFAGLIIACLFLANRMSYFSMMEINFGRGFLIQNGNLRTLVSKLLTVNILWGFLNLLPVYPLDGGQISRELFLMGNAREGIRRSLVLSVITAIVLAVAGLVLLQSLYMALMFGFMAYSNYTTLQAYLGRGGGGFGGGFGGGSGGGSGGGRFGGGRGW